MTVLRFLLECCRVFRYPQAGYSTTHKPLLSSAKPRVLDGNAGEVPKRAPPFEPFYIRHRLLLLTTALAFALFLSKMERDGGMIVTGSRGVGASPGTAVLSQNVHGVNLTGGNLTLAGGDVHHTVHYHAGHTVGPSVLDSVPNLRGIHIANSSRATQGTGSWVRRWEIFWLWLNPEWFLMILWGFGMPGAGKTILTSIVINILEEYARASSSLVCICYIYFRYSDHAEFTVRGCLETLVKQTIERHPHCVSHFDAVYARHIREKTQPSEEELLALLRQFVGLMAITVYALDALDEAPPKIQLELLEKLASLNVKLFITSRPLKTLEAHFPSAHRFPIVAHNDDITLHINQEISRSAELRGILQKADQSLHNKIVASVIQKCGGMFLHASLQLSALRECTSVYEVEQTLAAFPTDIEDLYLQTWQRILAQVPSKSLLARNTLTWVIHATRSLTIQELQRAVATCPDTHKFVPDRLVQEDVLIGLCHGLVDVEEKTQLVRLVHYTAKDCMERLVTETIPQPHTLISAVCLAQLTEHGFQSTALADYYELKEFLQAEPLLEYAYNSWSTHAQKSLADPLAAGRLTEFAQNCHAFPVINQWLYGWSALLHMLSPLHFVTYFNLPIAFAGSDALRNPNQHTAEQKATALHLACMQGHDGVVNELLHLADISLDARDDWDSTALIIAAGLGHERATRLLLACPDLNNLNALDLNTALNLSSKGGHKGTVALLLSCSHIDVNIRGRDWDGNTALTWASEEGHEDVATLLLSHPDIDVNATNLIKRTALDVAFSFGHEGIVKLLLSHPQINVNLIPRVGDSPLSQAVEQGWENIVRLLLTHPSIEFGDSELEEVASIADACYVDEPGESCGRILSLLEEFLNRA
ncbi:hypothetical protein BKA70DRAFT_1576531 [Coprinopsis sp. MPI-PUGE-AT-0042]|nr:hypothetical protein BKA70DRAFT_1576531 [Coprinopsis sp. MPI-PUGE-AT-0042]